MSIHAARIRFLITEYCEGPFYMGWHLYVRESTRWQHRNANGEWGWIRRVKEYLPDSIRKVFDLLRITIQGDGTCDYDGLAEIARRYPLGGKKVGRRPRGCIPVVDTAQGLMMIPGWKQSFTPNH